MNQADAFVQAILDDPDDGSLRLIYADWLEERGDPRGEFIRVQYALAGMDVDDPRRPPLEARERMLLLQHGSRWAGHLAKLVEHFAFARGFVENVTLDVQGFLECGPELFRLAPVQTVRLSSGSTGLPAVVAAPHLARVRGLNLSYLRFGLAEIQELVRSPYLDRLTSLDLTSDHIGIAGLRLLTGSPWMARVTTLHLGVNNLGVLGYRFLESANSTCLATLDLRGNPLGSAGGFRSFPALRDLNLSGTAQQNLYGMCLAMCKTLSGVEKLDLRFNKIGDAGVQALATAPLGQLRVLKLGYNPVGTTGVRVLASSPHLAQLTTLDLRRTRASNNAAKALIESPYLGRLWRLDLRGNDISQPYREKLRERFGEAVQVS
jgi:uncharacterized protein (TIGR02996 family)